MLRSAGNDVLGELEQRRRLLLRICDGSGLAQHHHTPVVLRSNPTCQPLVSHAMPSMLNRSYAVAPLLSIRCFRQLPARQSPSLN